MLLHRAESLPADNKEREKMCSVRWLTFSISCFNIWTRAFETLGRVSEDGHLYRFGARLAKFVQEAALRAVGEILSSGGGGRHLTTSPACQSRPQRGSLGVLILINLSTGNIMHNTIIGFIGPYNLGSASREKQNREAWLGLLAADSTSRPRPPPFPTSRSRAINVRLPAYQSSIRPREPDCGKRCMH